MTSQHNAAGPEPAGDDELDDGGSLRRRFLWLLLALAAFLASCAAVVIPPDQLELRYGWQPEPSGSDEAIAPLALARRSPDELVIRMPCAGSSTFATGDDERWLDSSSGVGSPWVFGVGDNTGRVLVDDHEVRITVGDRVVLRETVDRHPECVLSVTYTDGLWELATDLDKWVAPGPAPELSLARFVGRAASSSSSSVEVVTRELGTSPSPGQLGLIGASLVLLTVVGVLLARSSPISRRSVRVGFTVTRPDLLVFVALGTWLLLFPPGFDDGWILARQRQYEHIGAFSNLYDIALPLPLVHWVEWLQHWVTRLSVEPFFLRMPVLVGGLATWWVVRSLGRSVGISTGLPAWSLAGAFSVGFVAWASLRPEVLVALLLVASTALLIRFRQGPSAPLLLAWLILIVLGITAHPAGVVVASPLLVGSPAVWKWATGFAVRRVETVTVLLVASAVLVLMAFADSGLAPKLESIGAFSGSDSFTLDETTRYRILFESSSWIWRVSTVLLGLTLVASLVTFAVAAPPMRSLSLVFVLSAALLAVTPSKWPMHVGVLTGLAAVVLVGAALRISRLHWMWPAGLAILASLGFAWAWAPHDPWIAMDLRTQRWWPGAQNFVPVDLSHPVWWLLGTGLVAGGVIWTRRSFTLAARGAFLVQVLVVGLLTTAISLASFGLDVLRTDGWTLGRQSVGSLVGGWDCGAGEVIRVPSHRSLRALEEVEGRWPAADAQAVAAGLGPPGEPHSPSSLGSGLSAGDVVPDADVVHTSPAASTGIWRSSWYDSSVAPHVAVLVQGSVGTQTELIVQWLPRADDGSEEPILERLAVDGSWSDWWLVEVPPPPDAHAVRIFVRDEDSNASVTVSQPLGFASELLVSPAVLEHSIAVAPPLGLYVPCASLRPFVGGLVAAPGIFVLRDVWPPGGADWAPFGRLGPMSAAISTDRYFRLTAPIPPSDLGDSVQLIVSQEYLTGRSALGTGSFGLVDR